MADAKSFMELLPPYRMKIAIYLLTAKSKAAKTVFYALQK
jgi:hypothetical protein